MIKRSSVGHTVMLHYLFVCLYHMFIFNLKFDLIPTMLRHGSNCAGVIAAEGNNGNCGVGLAYNARIGGELNIQVVFEEKYIFVGIFLDNLLKLAGKNLYIIGLFLICLGIRLFVDEKAPDDKEAKALKFKRDYIDIYSNSWGPSDKGFEVEGPGTKTLKVLKEGAEEVIN